MVGVMLVVPIGPEEPGHPWWGEPDPDPAGRVTPRAADEEEDDENDEDLEDDEDDDDLDDDDLDDEDEDEEDVEGDQDV